MKTLQILDINLTESIDSASLKSSSPTTQKLSEHEEKKIGGGHCQFLLLSLRYAY